jgi:broad specificity phosphatase PhoE
MTVRVTLVAAGRSSDPSDERFGDDRPLDRAGWCEIQLVAPRRVPLAAADLRYCSPTPRSRATGDALGYAPLAQPALRGCDMGRWRGLTLGEAAATEPGSVDAWFADPRAAPHGGEPLLAFIRRVGQWLDTRPAENITAIVAVTEPTVLRAALVYALGAPPRTYWLLDIRPLAMAVLTGRPGQWSLRLEGI